MRTLLSEKKDFIIESNLSKATDYDWIALMRKNGYDTILFFLGTSNVEINKRRVRSRVFEGGHDVAEAIIEQRHRAGMSYIKTKILDFSEATLIDVSTEEIRPMVYLQNGSLLFKDDICPGWVNTCLDLVHRLAAKNFP